MNTLYCAVYLKMKKTFENDIGKKLLWSWSSADTNVIIHKEALCLGESGVKTLLHYDETLTLPQSDQWRSYMHGSTSRFITSFTELNTWHKPLVKWNINDGYEVMTVIISHSKSSFSISIATFYPPPPGKIIYIYNKSLSPVPRY